jgi:hypothetical protein
MTDLVLIEGIVAAFTPPMLPKEHHVRLPARRELSAVASGRERADGGE